MKQKNLLTRMLLLCALIVGSGSAWAEQTISSTYASSVSDGDIVAWGTTSKNLAKSVGSNWIYLSTTSSEWIFFKVHTVDGGFTLEETVSGNYIYSSAAKKVELSSTNKTILTIGSNGIVNGGSSIGNYTYNSTGIRPYSSNNYTSAYLYKVTPELANTTITVDGGISKTVDRTNNESSLTLTASASSGATVNFSIDNEETTLTQGTDFTFSTPTFSFLTMKSGVITVKATSDATATNKAAEETITITVIGEKEDAIIDVENQTLNVGESYTLVPDYDYLTDGTITLSSSNTNVVAIDNATQTVNAVAVGSATITIESAEGTIYKAGNGMFTITVTAPSGKTTAPNAEPIQVFYESFNSNASSGGNDGYWNGSIATGTFVADNEGWSCNYEKAGDKCAKFGTSSNGGSATTPALALETGITYTLTFKAGAWNKDGEGTTLNLSATNATIDQSSVNMTMGAWSNYSVEISDASDGAKVRFYTSAGNCRFFLDEVKVTKPAEITAPKVTLAASGYASYCCEYPLDFSTKNDNYRAWYVSKVEGETVTFSEITGTIKGGQGFILYGTPNAECELKYTDSTEELSGNMLIGTLAPTFVDADNIYGLSGGNFMKITSGVINANKAYLEIPGGSGARSLNIIFEDETTGIAEMQTVTTAGNEKFYNLNGQRVMNPAKGLYIVNGKKYIVK